MKKTDEKTQKDQTDVKKHVLVAVVGVTPSVLTTATWALAVDYGIVVDRVAVLTTKKGHEKISEQIFQKGVWDELRNDLKCRGFSVNGKLVLDPEGSVTIFKDENDRYVEDLLSSSANIRAANQMMDVLRPIVEDEPWVVHGLMTGGRKAMSAMFYSCMGLLGRPSDRVYHVLVSEGFEKPTLRPTFYFPKRGVRHSLVEMIGGEQKKRILRSEDAKINLFEVPFIPMGDWAEQKCKAMSRRLSYETIVKCVGQELRGEVYPTIQIDLAGKGWLLLDGCQLKLSHYLFPISIMLFQGFRREQIFNKMCDTKEWYRLGDGSDEIDEMTMTSDSWLLRYFGDDSGRAGNDRYGHYQKAGAKNLRLKDMNHDWHLLREKFIGAGFPCLERLMDAAIFPVDFDLGKVEWINVGSVPEGVRNRILPDVELHRKGKK